MRAAAYVTLTGDETQEEIREIEQAGEADADAIYAALAPIGWRADQYNWEGGEYLGGGYVQGGAERA